MAPGTDSPGAGSMSDLRRSTDRRLVALFTLSLVANVAATVTMRHHGPAWLAGVTVVVAAATLALAIAVEFAQWVRERAATA